MKTTITVVVHAPVPEGTLSFVMVALVIDEPAGPQSLMLPATWVPVNVPSEPPQPCSPPVPLPKSSLGAATLAVGGNALVKPGVEPVQKVGTKSIQGLLLLKLNAVEVVEKVSVPSTEPM